MHILHTFFRVHNKKIEKPKSGLYILLFSDFLQPLIIDESDCVFKKWQPGSLYEYRKFGFHSNVKHLPKFENYANNRDDMLFFMPFYFNLILNLHQPTSTN